MYKILTSGDVNTFEFVFPTSNGKTRDDAIANISAIETSVWMIETTNNDEKVVAYNEK